MGQFFFFDTLLIKFYLKSVLLRDIILVVPNLTNKLYDFFCYFQYVKAVCPTTIERIDLFRQKQNKIK